MTTEAHEGSERAKPLGLATTEGLGAVLTYHDRGGGVGGQTVGADGRGWHAVLFHGQPDDAYDAAFKYVSELKRSGRWLQDVCIVTNEQTFVGPTVRAVTVGA